MPICDVILSKTMNGMIFAAGLGKRLRPLTLKAPKPLIKLNNKPLIFYALEYMARAQVSQIAINTHWLADQIPKALGDSYDGIPIKYLYEPKLLDTGGGLKNACDQVLGTDEPVLLMNSDIYVELDLEGFLKTYQSKEPDALLLLKAVDNLSEYSSVGIDHQTRVLSVAQAGAHTHPDVIYERLFCGVHVISPRLLKKLPSQRVSKIFEDFYLPQIQSGANIQGFEQKGFYSDLGTPERLQTVSELFS